jgi:hypothetical protein
MRIDRTGGPGANGQRRIDMRKVILVTIFILMIYPVGASALTGLSIGGKIGSMDYSGDIFPGSGDLGSGTSYAVILGIGAMPMLDLELRASYFAKDLAYSVEYAGQTYAAGFEYRDVGVTALLVKDIFAPPGAPFSAYIGGGLGYHVINTEAAIAVAQGTISAADADNPIALMDEVGKMSGEGVAGVKISAPAFPLAAFGEFKYGVILTEERLTMMELSGGLMIRF